ncbi:MAG TPA: hypothetical protein VFJ98_08060 [Mycobacteriales bacterium]|nr:hypothetical protein [Mycobacteriales bacterium]
MADDAPWIEPVVVPDDISSLQADIDAYHRERRLASRRRLLRWLTGGGRFRRAATPVAVVASALGLAAIVFAVLTLADPGLGHRALPAPVAASPPAAVGELHGLLPDLTIRTQSGEPVSLRGVRPALVALLPVSCHCSELINSLAGQAEEVGAPLVAIAPAATDAEVAALPGQTRGGRVSAYFDPTHALADIYAASGVTLLVVSPDATVSHLMRDVQPGAHLEAQLFDGIRMAPAVPR